jgi:hypothetical protein
LEGGGWEEVGEGVREGVLNRAEESEEEEEKGWYGKRKAWEIEGKRSS